MSTKVPIWYGEGH